MSNNWWKTYFNEDYLRLWEARGGFRHTKKEVDFIGKQVPLKKSDLILDLCCGHGRHTLELARRGYKVAGLDYSRYELALARAEAEKQGLDVELRRGDARRFSFKEKFDVIINMFTAFGYGSREDDRRIIRSVRKNLKKGGKFLIDLMGYPWLMRNFKRRVINKGNKNVYAVCQRRYDFLENIGYETRTYVNGKRRKVYNIKHRDYTLSELNQLLASEGLKVIKYWGSFDGKPFGLDSKRMIVLARRV